MTSAFWRECAFEPIVRSFEDAATHQNRSRNLGAPAWCSRSRMKHFEDLGAILGSTWWVRPAPRISDPWVPAWSPAEASLPAAPTSADGTVADCCCPQRPGSTNGVAFDSSTGGKVDMVLTSAAETYSNNIQKEKREKLALLSKTMLTKKQREKLTCALFGNDWHYSWLGQRAQQRMDCGCQLREPSGFAILCWQLEAAVGLLEAAQRLDWLHGGASTQCLRSHEGRWVLRDEPMVWSQ